MYFMLIFLEPIDERTAVMFTERFFRITRSLQSRYFSHKSQRPKCSPVKVSQVLLSCSLSNLKLIAISPFAMQTRLKYSSHGL
jgi:hypothetical protein